MGLCKCDRKKVTNLFCFEHRVNVCEFCLTTNHPTLPPTTAPAGYECPACAQSIIPLANQGGPVAEALRQKLASAKWIKPNLQERYSSARTKAVSHKAHESLAFNDGKLLDSALDTFAKQFLHDHEMVTTPQALPPRSNDTVVSMDLHGSATEITSGAEFRGNSTDIQVPANESYSKPRTLLINYEDRDKYRRHPYPPSQTAANALGLMSRISSAASRIFLRYRLFCIFGLIILIFSASMIIASIIGEPASSEKAMIPSRLKVPADA
ncbi:unnamed protein product [Mesocestoides corti]|uniref:ZFPL1-like B-box zinc-binding domain-containing protein n=1 Tax=Mesocestoides corti TaxID=53468 RepID=A0A0R3UEI9_MESCO|nr:unnamed protein product [Mesocestoides corti]